ncbi:phage regulatory CII family protein [Alkalimonas sp. NCh-2]|uniref:phage regulatory CII family protein n=1 Tax=Alkalimonas sp. NCh-2 TaxID=3144846 RepID=UPI0031F5F53F
MSKHTKKAAQILHSCPMEAAYQLGKANNASELARKLGISPVVLANKLNPHQEFHRLTLGEAVAITELSNDDRILESWAHSRGCVLVHVPDVVGCDEELSDQVMRLSEEMGETMGYIRQARSDGVITPAEFEGIQSKIISMIREAVALKSLVKGQVRDLPVSRKA